MARNTPMTPERFQSRDVKRRLSKLEKQMEYLRKDLHRELIRHNDLERWLLPLRAFIERQEDKEHE